MGSTRFAYGTYNQRITKYTSPNGGLLRRSIVKCPKQDILWYRIITVASPRMTAENAAHRKIQPLEWAMLPECFEGILRAGRSEPA